MNYTEKLYNKGTGNLAFVKTVQGSAEGVIYSLKIGELVERDKGTLDCTSQNFGGGTVINQIEFEPGALMNKYIINTYTLDADVRRVCYYLTETIASAQYEHAIPAGGVYKLNSQNFITFLIAPNGEQVLLDTRQLVFPHENFANRFHVEGEFATLDSSMENEFVQTRACEEFSRGRADDSFFETYEAVEAAFNRVLAERGFI